LKRRLRDIAGAAAVIERGLEAYDSKTETGAGLLHRLLERQHYRIAYWRVAFSAVNYRRFFDINDLAGLRVEDPATFRAIHSLVSRLIVADRLQGLRLDHIDGLRDPAQYTKRLSHLIRKWRREAGLPTSFYVIVEKILADGEQMPRFPGVAGTTGYEWLNMFSHVLVYGHGLERMHATYREFAGEQRDFAAILDAAKQHVIETILASEFGVLCGALSRIAAGHFSTRDFTIDRLRAALRLYVLESDPNIIQEILVEKAEAFGRDPATRRSFAPVIGDTSLFLAEGADWRWQRREVAPIFRHETLLSFVPTFATMAQRQVERWRAVQRAVPIDAAAAMTHTPFEIIVEAM